jgi:serine/threonine-protein kinase
MAEQLGPYLLEKRIGAGGMADVFLARGPRGLCVVKRPHPHLCANPEFVRMFLDEAALLAQLHHPGIAQIDDLGHVGGVYYLAMEYVPGFDLMTISLEHERHGELMLPELCARIVADAAEALHFAHEARGANGQALKIIHRDVTPHNILLSTQGQVKLIDFGVARASSATHRTQAGFVKGKYPYMAPEQITGQYIDRRVDVYALGLVLYELLTNVRAIAGQTEIEQIDNARAGRIRPIEQLRPNTPVPLRQIVGSCLLVDADSRYPTALALKQDLEKYIDYERHVVGREDLLRLFRVVAAEVHQQEDPPTTQPVPGPGDDVWLSGRPTELEHAPGQMDPPAEVSLAELELGQAITTPSLARIQVAQPPIRLSDLADDGQDADGQDAAAAPTGQATEAIDGPRHSRLRLPAALVVAGLLLLAAAALVLLGGPPPVTADADAGVLARFVFPPVDSGSVVTERPKGFIDGGVAELVPGSGSGVGVGVSVDAEAPSPPRVQAASLNLSSVPEADVIIDKERWGKTPLSAELSPGTHTVVLENRRERFRSTQTVRLAPGETKSLQVVGKKGILRIRVTPFAEIRINGEPLSPPGQISYKEVELYEGTYQVDLELTDVSLPVPKTRRARAVVRGGEVTEVDQNMLGAP